MPKDKTLEKIIKECVALCNYRKNVSPNNYKIYRDEYISTAIKAITDYFLSLVPEDKNRKRTGVFADYVDGFNSACEIMRRKIRGER